MAFKVNRSHVNPTIEKNLTVWRVLERVNGHAEFGAIAGIVTYGPPGSESDKQMGGAHDKPEIHYMLSGQGTLVEDGEPMDLEAGDVVVIPPGRRHAIWGSSSDPLTGFYVAMVDQDPAAAKT